MAEPRRPDCLRCRHFFVDWPTSTRGCRAYGFRAASYPSLVVERSSGTPCQLYEPATRAPATKPRHRG